jgi:hypothetical protein
MKKPSFKMLSQEFGTSSVIDSFLAGLLYSVLAGFPIIVIILQFILVNMYLLTLLSFMIIIAVFGLVVLLHYLWKKSLELKKPNPETDIKKLFIKSTIITNSVILVIGILVIFVLVPYLMV